MGRPRAIRDAAAELGTARLVAASVQTVTDMYGRPLSAINGQNITLDDRLVYLRF
jgi:hypothetical protein